MYYHTAGGIELHSVADGDECIDTGALLPGMYYGAWCAWAGDASKLAVIGDGIFNGVAVIDTTTGSVSTPTFAVSNPRRCALSPDGTKLAVTRNTSPYLSVIDIATMSAITVSGGNPPNAARGVAWSPDGDLLAVGHFSSPYLTVYETATWTKLTITGGNPEGAVLSCAWSADGSKLATGADNVEPALVVYNVADWSKIGAVPSIGGSLRDCAWSPDGSLLAVADYYGYAPQVYETATWTLESTLDTVGAHTESIDFSPDGLTVVCTSTGVPFVRCYDTSTWTKTTPFPQGGKLGYGTCAKYSKAAGVQPKYVGTTSANPITDQDGDPVAAVVRLYDRESGAMEAEETADAGGVYSIGPMMFPKERQVVFLDPDGDPVQNDIIHRVIPE